MTKNEILCNELAKILKGHGHTKGNVCTIMRDRKNIDVSILGVKSHSAGNMFVFEFNPDENKTLILGEMVLLEGEVPYIASSLYDQGIAVSAIHSHWLNDKPHLIYIHMNTIMNAHQFARKVAKILSTIE